MFFSVLFYSNTFMVQDKIHFDALTGLWSIMDMAYYSYVQIYVFGQKIDGHEVSDSLSVL